MATQGPRQIKKAISSHTAAYRAAFLVSRADVLWALAVLSTSSIASFVVAAFIVCRSL